MKRSLAECLAALCKVIHPRNAERVAAALRRGIESARKSVDRKDVSTKD